MLDCEIYVDSEEDEVFFRNYNEQKERIDSELIDNLALKSEFEKANDNLKNNNNHFKTNIFEGLSDKNDFKKETDKIPKNNLPESTIYSCSSNLSNHEVNNSLDSEEQFHSFQSNNTSVELDHNYSYTKQKIDESILSTPKSVVKADKDGGFLKVLSEIALVKAEADFKLEVSRKMDAKEKIKIPKKKDEDKENKICIIPEIKIIEATPEKPLYTLSSQNITSLQFKKSEITCNSSQLSDLDKKKNKLELFTEKKVSFKNFIKKNCSKTGSKENLSFKKTEIKVKSIKKSRRNSWPNAMETWNNCIDVIDVSDESFSEEVTNKTFKDVKSFPLKEELKNQSENKDNCLTKEINSNFLENSSALKSFDFQNLSADVKENVKVFSILEKQQISYSKTNYELNSKELPENILIRNEKTFTFTEPVEVDPSKTMLKEKGVNALKILLPENDLSKDISKILNINELKPKDKNDTLNFTLKKKTATPAISKTFQKFKKNAGNCRFSKEAKKVVEALKTCSMDDTLNFTIPEINVEEMENSFLSPDPISAFDTTLLDKNDHLIKSSFKPPSLKVKDNNNELNMPLKVDEKKTDAVTKTPETRLRPLKYFSDKKSHYAGTSNEIKKCFKELSTPYNIKVPSKAVQSSGKKIETKIPVSVSKTKLTKIPSNCLSSSKRFHEPNITPYKQNAEDARTCKTFSGNHPKASKFKNVASPIGAYIHNKPTALVVKVKPHNRKDGFLSTMTNLLSENAEEIPIKIPNEELGLPFVEYKRTKSFKIEKRPEKHLPRLAPAVEKLIGTNSPKILKHKGRFYIKTPSKKDVGNVDSTILADKNEVSVIVSQIAQKSTTLS